VRFRVKGFRIQDLGSGSRNLGFGCLDLGFKV